MIRDLREVCNGRIWGRFHPSPSVDWGLCQKQPSFVRCPASPLADPLLRIGNIVDLSERPIFACVCRKWFWVMGLRNLDRGFWAGTSVCKSEAIVATSSGG